MESENAAPKRQARGADRRRAIAEAALRVIEREGLDGVTHRTVAAEANVPLASTTYYFASKQVLMAAAMELLIAREARDLEQLGRAVLEQEMSIDAAVDALVGYHAALWREQRLAQIAQFELYLRIARTDERPSSWIEPYLGVARAVLASLGSSEPERDAQSLVALINGMSMHELTAPQEDFEERVLGPVLRHWFAAVLGAQPV